MFKTGAILREYEQCVGTVSQFKPQRVFFFLLSKSLQQHRLNQGTPYSLLKVYSFQARYFLSNLNGWCRSYLRSTNGCQTKSVRCFDQNLNSSMAFGILLYISGPGAPTRYI